MEYGSWEPSPSSPTYEHIFSDHDIATSSVSLRYTIFPFPDWDFFFFLVAIQRELNYSVLLYPLRPMFAPVALHLYLPMSHVHPDSPRVLYGRQDFPRQYIRNKRTMHCSRTL